MWSGYSEKGTGSQEKGPATFAIQQPGVQQARASGEQSEVRGGLKGQQGAGSAVRATAVSLPQGQQDNTLGVLLKLGESLIAPQVAKIRTQQTVQGMQRVASGEALTDIVNEQPWYSKIFGDDPMVEGAMAYSVQAQTQTWASEQENQMAELRKRSPSEIPGYIMESMGKFMTGDPDTDALIKANIGKAVPGVIKRHTKENYAYMQEQASEARMRSWSSAAESVRVMYQAAPDMYTPDEYAQREQDMLASLVPTAGANEESWYKDIRQFISGQAEGGNFHAINVLRKGGVLSNMKQEDKLKTEQFIDRYSAWHASQAAINYSDGITAIKVDAHSGRLSAHEVQDAYEKLNNSYTAISGNPKGVVGKGEIVGDARAAAVYAITASQKQLAAAATSADAQTRQNGLVQSLWSGDAALAGANGFKSTEVDNTFLAEWTAKMRSGDIGSATKLLVNNGLAGYDNKYVKSEILRLVNNGNGEQYNENWGAAYGLWKNIRTAKNGGEATAQQYFDERTHMRMAAFESALAGRDPAQYGEWAYQQSLRARGNPGVDISKDDRKGMKDYLQGGMFSSGAAPGLTPESEQLVTNLMGQAYGTLKGVTTGDQLPKDALARAKASGLEVLGKHAWVRDNNQRDLYSYFSSGADPSTKGLTREQLADDFSDVVDARVKALGGDGNARVLRGVDEQGKATFQIFTFHDGVSLPPAVFNTDDLKAHRKAIRDGKLPQRQPSGAAYASPVQNPSGAIMPQTQPNPLDFIRK